MVNYLWIIAITVTVGIVQLFTVGSLELTILLFTLNFMAFSLELLKTEEGGNILLKIGNIERFLNDTVSTLVSPRIARISKDKKEILEWLNRF